MLQWPFPLAIRRLIFMILPRSHRTIHRMGTLSVMRMRLGCVSPQTPGRLLTVREELEGGSTP